MALLEKLKTTEDKAECRRKNENSDEKETIIAGLRSQIEQLKKEVVEKDETIDFLVEERDDRSQHIFKLRLKLADAWHITFPDDADKIREVARLEDTDENPKSYCEAARSMKKRMKNQKERMKSQRTRELMFNLCINLLTNELLSLWTQNMVAILRIKPGK